jgi:hypothetical protein
MPEFPMHGCGLSLPLSDWSSQSFRRLTAKVGTVSAQRTIQLSRCIEKLKLVRHILQSVSELERLGLSVGLDLDSTRSM